MRWEKPLSKEANEEHLVTLLDGKLFILNQGNFVSLNIPIILRDGCIITTEGVMKTPDGKSRTLQEGEFV